MIGGVFRGRRCRLAAFTATWGGRVLAQFPALPRNRLQSLPLLARDLARIGAAKALELQVLANGVIEQSHSAATPYWARATYFCDYTSVAVCTPRRCARTGL
jgi:hypothetical protein